MSDRPPNLLESVSTKNAALSLPKLHDLPSRASGSIGQPPASGIGGHGVTRYVPLILAKPSVQGVIRHQLHDSRPHEFPHGGLFDEHDQPKPALNTPAAIRRVHVE